MARSLRIEYSGAVSQVTSRENEKKPVSRNGTDRRNFLNTIHVQKTIFAGNGGSLCFAFSPHRFLLSRKMRRKHIPTLGQLLRKASAIQFGVGSS